ncbi:MAG TPA: transcriptional repressor LexA [Actinomycetota bacterium]|nr:transcriptional repressor LexA [Actinomycetota bacterium]
MQNLTPRQRRILEFIRRTVDERGYPPTVREIGRAVGLTSSSSVHAQLANLERLGLLRRDPAKPRALELRHPATATRPRGVSVPLVGRVTAGPPALAEQSVEDYLVLPSGYADAEGHFALRVRGDSMVGAGILDGDVVVVRRQEAAEDGAIVAALLPGPGEEEATVKRIRRHDGRILLVPENPSMEPIELPPEGRILGRVVAVLRRL